MREKVLVMVLLLVVGMVFLTYDFAASQQEGPKLGALGGISASQIRELLKKAHLHTVTPGTAWEGDIPATKTLTLLARLGFEKPAGGNYALDVSVNGQRISAPLLNKAQNFKYADGRTFPYYNSSGAPGWLVQFSPDFVANDTSAAGTYQVVTNPGQAYLYMWDISSLVGTSPKVRVRVYNNGRGSNTPIIFSLVTMSVAERLKTLSVIVYDEQRRAVAGTSVRVGVPPCSGEGTTDKTGLAVITMPPGCP